MRQGNGFPVSAAAESEGRTSSLYTGEKDGRWKLTSKLEYKFLLDLDSPVS